MFSKGFFDRHAVFDVYLDLLVRLHQFRYKFKYGIKLVFRDDDQALDRVTEDQVALFVKSVQTLSQNDR